MRWGGRLLFCYGTLRSDVRSALGATERARLSRAARSVGPATIRGALYDLGQYPVLLSNGAERAEVRGEAFLLENPEATFAWLDPYEGVVAGEPQFTEFVRAEREIRLASGHVSPAWVYLYLRAPRAARRLVANRWPK